MAILSIYNGEPAPSVMSKLNSTIAEANTLSFVAQADTALQAGQAVYVKANAKLAPSTHEVFGLAKTTVSSGIAVEVARQSLTLASWVGATGLASLSVGSIYYLNPSQPGKLISLPPSTSGQRFIRVGRAVSSTTLIIDISQPITL